MGLALLAAQLVGCGRGPAALTDDQLQMQLQEAERQWKITGAQVSESDAPFITDPKIQAAYKNLKALRSEDAARSKARQ
ncbi:MAG TPA: hypothetical protein VHV08_14470 [Pirellulales bacterium]|nr:hypothetical protein [Pirellulales bacterium]